MKLIDTHAHLDTFVRDGTLDAVLERARTAGVERIIACSTTPADWILYRKLAQKHPDIISWQAGIQPQEIADGDDDAIDALSSYFIDGEIDAPVAVGEIGLDFFKMPESEESEKNRLRQREVFRRQLGIARDLDLKVCVHARGALSDCRDEIANSGLPFSNVVFHCYAGTAHELCELNELGARASFTGIITFKNAGEMRAAMLAQGIERLMLETDSPYLAPVPMRGSRCESSMLSLTARAAAEIFEVSTDTVAEITTRNAISFFAGLGG